MRDIIDLRILFATNIFDNLEAPIPPNHPVLLKIQNEYKFSKVCIYIYINKNIYKNKYKI